MAAFFLFCGLVRICLSCVTSAPITNDDPKIIDMSYPYDENETIVWPGAKRYRQEIAYWGPYPDENGSVPFLAAFNFQTGEHVGTHMDAPIHFYQPGKTIDQVPLERTIGEAVVINITAKAEKNPDYKVSVSDLEEWEKAHGRMPDKPIVFLYTGYGKYWPNMDKYLGKNTLNDSKSYHFPGLTSAAATWLCTKRNLKMYGVDTISLDAGIESTNYPVHRIFAKLSVSGIENVANLHLLPPRGAEVFAAPMKMKGGSGGPTRLFARIGNKKDVTGGTAFIGTRSHFGLVSLLVVAIFTWLII